jgi:cytochrome c-type biogenesis protein CcmE
MRSKRITKRLVIIVSVASLLVMTCLKIFSDNISLFLKPAEVYEKLPEIHGEIKIGGYVKDIKFDKISLVYSFIITDNNSHDIYVNYKGPLPSLFKENQMSIVSAVIDKNNSKDRIYVIAREVLAKHDENYKPKAE